MLQVCCNVFHFDSSNHLDFFCPWKARWFPSRCWPLLFSSKIQRSLCDWAGPLRWPLLGRDWQDCLHCRSMVTEWFHCSHLGLAQLDEGFGCLCWICEDWPGRDCRLFVILFLFRKGTMRVHHVNHLHKWFDYLLNRPFSFFALILISLLIAFHIINFHDKI
jgi:hypothetical protein